MDVLGTDIKLIDDYMTSARGDIQTISGIENLKESIYRRLITPTGQLIHRPKYGVGIFSFCNKPNTESNRSELVNKIRFNLCMEHRIKKINSIVCDWSNDLIMIQVNINAFGIDVGLNYEVVKI